MKLLFLATLLFSLSSFPATNYLKCIGKEEAKIHKNRWGGAYKALNQSIINEFAMFSESIEMNKEIEKKICSESTQKPSLVVLEHMFLGDELFFSSINSQDLKQHAIDKTSIESFTTSSYYIFLDYLAALQIEIGQAHCLKQEFPHLAKFYTRARYILSDVGMKTLVKEIPDKKKIFEKLQSENWKASCSPKDKSQ
tara:strand:+ start:8250 stop:8837 length:588 start_codon:yes stop_codon:yes gene_type:complete